MTFATISVTGGNSNAEVNERLITLPSVNAGDMLAVLFANDGSATVTWDQDTVGAWDPIFTSTANGTAVRLTGYKRCCNGTEGGAQLKILTSANERSCWQIARGVGASDVLAGAPATGTSVSPDPADFTPGGGAQDFVWMPVFAADAATADAAGYAYPTNYTTNGVYVEANNAAGCGLGVSWRSNNAASENVGAWTINTSEQWIAVTLAFVPGVGTQAPIVPTPRPSMTQSLAAACNKPADAVAGDYLWASAFRVTSAVAPSPPAGWTSFHAGTGNGVGFLICGRLLTSDDDDDTSYTFTNATDVRIVAYRGDTIDPANPASSGTGNFGNSATITGTGLTTEVDFAKLLAYLSFQSDPTSAFGTMSEISGVTEPNTGLYQEVIETAGATGNRTASMSSGLWHAQMVSLNPPPPADAVEGDIATGAPAQVSAIVAVAIVDGVIATGAPAQASQAAAAARVAGAAQTGAPAQATAAAAAAVAAAVAATGAPAQASALAAGLKAAGVIASAAPAQSSAAIAAAIVEAALATGAPAQVSAAAGSIPVEGARVGAIDTNAPAQSSQAAAVLAVGAAAATGAPAQTSAMAGALRVAVAVVTGAPVQASAAAGVIATESVSAAIATGAPAAIAAAAGRLGVAIEVVTGSPAQVSAAAARLIEALSGALATGAPAQASAAAGTVAIPPPDEVRILPGTLDAAAQRFADAIGADVWRAPIGAQEPEENADGTGLVAALSEGAGTQLAFCFGAARPFEFEHRAAFELIAIGGDEAARKARCAKALAAAHTALAADPTLGGLVDWAELEEPDPTDVERYDALAAVLTLTYTAPTALG